MKRQATSIAVHRPMDKTDFESGDRWRFGEWGERRKTNFEVKSEVEVYYHRMLFWLSVCVCVCPLVLTNGLERELVSKQMSAFDVELFSFAEVALKEYFRGESPIRITSISRVTQCVSVFSEERRTIAIPL